MINSDVAPFRGAWIEISVFSIYRLSVSTSLPLGERGLKFITWLISMKCAIVAPFRGAWIEMDDLQHYSLCPPSLPLGERGLKYALTV